MPTTTVTPGSKAWSTPARFTPGNKAYSSITRRRIIGNLSFGFGIGLSSRVAYRLAGELRSRHLIWAADSRAGGKRFRRTRRGKGVAPVFWREVIPQL